MATGMLHFPDKLYDLADFVLLFLHSEAVPKKKLSAVEELDAKFAELSASTIEF